MHNNHSSNCRFSTWNDNYKWKGDKRWHPQKATLSINREMHKFSWFSCFRVSLKISNIFINACPFPSYGFVHALDIDLSALASCNLYSWNLSLCRFHFCLMLLSIHNWKECYSSTSVWDRSFIWLSLSWLNFFYLRYVVGSLTPPVRNDWINLIRAQEENNLSGSDNKKLRERKWAM